MAPVPYQIKQIHTELRITDHLPLLELIVERGFFLFQKGGLLLQEQIVLLSLRVM
jgi:hypothetical protein